MEKQQSKKREKRMRLEEIISPYEVLQVHYPSKRPGTLQVIMLSRLFLPID